MAGKRVNFGQALSAAISLTTAYPPFGFPPLDEGRQRRSTAYRQSAGSFTVMVPPSDLLVIVRNL